MSKAQKLTWQKHKSSGKCAFQQKIAFQTLEQGYVRDNAGFQWKAE
jgi:hypothetical protein